MPSDEYADEIDRLEERSANDPRTHTFARLADLYRKAGELERALEVVESGLRHHPHYLNARIVHARLLRELGRPDAAVEAFERVLRIDSQNLVAQTALTELRDGGDGGPSLDAGPSEERVRPLSSGWLARLEEDWQSGREEETRGASPAESAPPPPGSGPAGAGADVEVEAGGADRSSESEAAPESGAADETSPESGAADETSPKTVDAPPAEDHRSPGPESEPSGEVEDQVVPAEPASAAPRSRTVIRRDAGDLETATLAELYARQGLFDEAIGIFERLLARDPYNARLAAALEEARRQARGKAPRGSSNGHGGREDVDRGREVGDGCRDETKETEARPMAPAARTDRRRGEPRPGRPTGHAFLSAGAPVPTEGAATPDAESIRAFLGRLLEGRFEPPGGAGDGGGVDLDEWLDSRGG